MLRLEMPAQKSPWKATSHQLKMHHRNSESRTSQLRSATHEYCLASRRLATVPVSSCRSIGYSCPPDSASAARNTRLASEGRLSVLGGVAPRWETHSTDKTDPAERSHCRRQRSS